MFRERGGGGIKMRRILILALVTNLVLISALHADLRLVRKIPAPNGCNLPGLSKITGLAKQQGASGPVSLFVTSQCDTMMRRSFLHVIAPSNGHVSWQHEFTLEPPECGAEGPHLSSGDFTGTSHQYVLTDECGEIMWIVWDKDTLYISESYIADNVNVPAGVALRNDSLFIVDRESDALHIMDTYGTLLNTYSLPYGAGVNAIAPYKDNFFVAYQSDTTRVFEITGTAALVETHYADGLAGCYPQSLAFVGDELYVGCTLDSILVFQFLSSYQDSVGPGDSVVVDIVPGELEITFDSVVDSGVVNALVYGSQPCPPPPGVDFFSPYYEVGTTSSLRYISELAFTDSSLESGMPTELVRVFSRPSGTCGTWRDITVDSTRVLPTLKILTRTRSEDDEFSVFALGFDNRDQYDVVRDKFRDLEGHIISARDSIPLQAYNEMRDLVDEGETAFTGGLYRRAAAKVDTVAVVAASTTGIPNRYIPGDPGKNVAGRIIGRAHSLAFSIRFYPGWLAGTRAGGNDYQPLLMVGPNPAGRSVEIRYAPAEAGRLQLAVYSVTGERVKMLYEGPPEHTPVLVRWEGRNDQGVEVSTGVYFVVAREGDKTAARKIILQR
jgi:hypothetical protein